MSKYKPTLIERETIILFNEAEPDAEVYTYNKKLIGRLKKHPAVAKLKRRDDTGACTFTLPKKLLTITVREPPSEEYKELQRQLAIKKNKTGVMKPFQKQG